MLTTGNIVKVADIDIRFHNAFGEVIKIKDQDDTGHTICVRIHNAFRMNAFFDEERETWYKPEELELHNDYPVDIKVKGLFGKVWLVYTYEKALQVNEDDCVHAECDKKATKRCLINIWGVAYEVDLCPECTEKYHGKRIDVFPWKKEMST